MTNCMCTTWDNILSSCERIMACYPSKCHRSQRYGRAPLRRPRSLVQRCTCLDWRLNCILLCRYGNAKRVTNSIWTNSSVFVLPPTEGYPKHRHKIWPGTSGKHARRIFPFELKSRSTNITEGTSGLFVEWLNHYIRVLWCRCTWGDTCQQQAGRLRWTFSPCLAASKTIGLTRTRTAL